MELLSVLTHILVVSTQPLEGTTYLLPVSTLLLPDYTRLLAVFAPQLIPPVLLTDSTQLLTFSTEL